MRAEFPRLVSKLLDAARQVPYLPRTWRLVHRAVGGPAFLWLGLLVAQGLVPAATVYLSRPLIDSLGAALGSGGDMESLAPVLWIAGAIGAALLLGEALRSAADSLLANLAARLEDHVSALIQEKSTTVDLGFYESADFHDRLHRARDEARYRPIALLQNGGALAQNAITLLALAAVLAPYGAWMSAALLVSTLPALVVVLRFAFLQHEWRTLATVDQRRADYLDWLMTAGENAAEARLFGLGPRWRSAYDGLRTRLRRERALLMRRQAVGEVLAGSGALLIAGGCVAWVGWRAVQGTATLGDVALFYLSFSQGQRLMRSLLSSVGHIYYNVLFIGNLFEFLDLPVEVLDPTNPATVTPRAGGVDVTFHDVTFRYPGNAHVALRNFSLDVPAGQVVAIVGANGAGKSTVIKLLCRFYDPQGGHVGLGGVDLRALALADVRAMVTALFQQPVHYNATVAENIALDAETDRRHVQAAAGAAGAEGIIARLPRGYETLLGRWFEGGVELSIGEWQRIALARAFLRASPLLLLDEPTSAMDSWAEADWMKRFRAIASGRTAIVVTHRFTTAMQADVIHVMDEGRIVESGSHEELLARNGRYAQSWRSQMRESPRSHIRGVA